MPSCWATGKLEDSSATKIVMRSMWSERRLFGPLSHHDNAPYLGPGTIGVEPTAGFLGTGTVTSRCSPLLLRTLKATLPCADPAAMLLATACALSTFLPPASTMTSPATIPLSWAGLPAVTAVTSAPFVASGRLFCLRSSAVNVRIFNPIRGESCALAETANESTTTARTLAIARTINIRSRITILHRRGAKVSGLDLRQTS